MNMSIKRLSPETFQSRETVLGACNQKPKLLDRKKVFDRVVSQIMDIINKFDDALGDFGDEE
jgi:type I restriction enzyme, R subunit